MKLLRHILSHLLFITFLVALISVFYYRTLLLPNNILSKVDEVVKDVYPPALNFVSKREYFWSIKGKRIVSFDDLNIFRKDDVAPAEVEKPILATDDSSNAKKEEETQTTSTKRVEIKDEKLKNIETTIEKPEEKQVENIAAKSVPKQEQITLAEVKDKDTSSERDLLIDARIAFNKGNVSTSEKLYLELIELEQDNPDAFGELGNVYYFQGKWNKAGLAYYEAAVRLIAEGNYSQVSYLQRVISGLNTEYSEKLSQLMMKR